MNRIIFFSSGIGSYCTAKRVITEHGRENTFLLFADTLAEDSDNYRFLYESSQLLGLPLVRVTDGRTIWDVFKDKRWLGNSKLAHCTFELKQKCTKRWIQECEFSHIDTLLYIGIDWSETHRLKSITTNHLPFKVVAPMTEYPYLDKLQMLNLCKENGLKPPRMYNLGYSHSNCGGQCVKGGVAYWTNTYKVFPERFLEAESKEQEVRDYLGSDVTILTRQVKGKRENLTLKQLREEIDSKAKQLSLFEDWGSACSCFSDVEG